MIPNEILKKIDDETDIVSLASEFISLEKKGKNYFGLCPFHEENTPSFSVSPEKNIAMCMGCGEGGRPINFYRKIKNIPFVQAVTELADKLGIEIPNARPVRVDPNLKYYEIMEEATKFYNFNLFNSKAGHEALKYLENRRLSEETINHFKIGYSSSERQQLYQILRDKDYKVSDMIDLGLVKQSKDGSYYDMFTNRIIFPITNPNGRVVGFSGRTLDNKSNHKYVNSPETKIFKKGELLYHINEGGPSIRRRKHAVLYEGFFDVISTYQEDFKNGIATMGTALTSNQARLIKKNTDKVVVAFDGDNAGQNAAIQSIKPLQDAGLIVEILNIPEQLDPDDFIKQYGANEYDNLFSKQALDPFAFQYNIYRNGVNLSDANDIKKFENEILNMLRDASPSIQNIYIKRLAKDLGVDEDIFVIPKPKFIQKQIKSYNEPKNIPQQQYSQEYNHYHPGDDYIPEEPYEQNQHKTYEPVELPRKVTTRRANKFENAEIRLLILMMRSKVWSNRICNELETLDYANLLNGVIRRKLNSYYKDNELFSLTDFKACLNEEEILHLEDTLFKDEFWTDQKRLEDKEIHTYINLVKNASKVREVETLERKIIKLSKSKRSYELELIEFIRLKNELDNLKGEIE